MQIIDHRSIKTGKQACSNQCPAVLWIMQETGTTKLIPIHYPFVELGILGTAAC